MRRFWLVAAMLGSVSAAQAADMPVLRGGFADDLPTTTNVNWQGFYVGGQGGYGSSDPKLGGANTGLITNLLDHNVIEQMQVSTWQLPFGAVSTQSAAYGVFTGYNTQWDDVVLGLEASYVHGKFGGSASAFKRLVSGSALTDNFFHDVGVSSSAGISISDMATFRGRAAYAWGCFLPYLFGGFALGNADITRSVVITDAISDTRAGPFSPLVPLSASEGLHNHLVYGYTLGLGVDVNLTGGLFMRAEWEYVRFTNQLDTAINTARLGLGYKF